MIRAVVIVAFFVFLFNIVTAHSTVSKSTVTQVWNKLQKKGGTNYKLYFIEEDKGFNAYASHKGVLINNNMLQFLDNKDQVAFILAHEIGHMEHGDVHKLSGSYHQESSADWYGAELMSKSGYRLCEAIRFFKKSISIYGDPESRSHPRDGLRIQHIGGGCK